jgi:hypothetical protein
LSIVGWHRVYFWAVGSFALWVGIWGYFFPAEVARAIPWGVPPLHARFIGSMYLSGMVLMLGGLLTLGRGDVKVALWMAAVWTGMLLVASLLNLGEFDYSRPPVWFWFAAYIVYSIAGAWLAWRHAVEPGWRSSREMPGWLKAWLVLQGIVCVALAAALFFRPELMGSVWPWRIPVLLTQIYAGPFLSYGIGSLLSALQRRLTDAGIALLSMFAFALLVLIASIIHLPVFDEITMAATIWFAGFGIVTVVLAFAGLTALKARAA